MKNRNIKLISLSLIIVFSIISIVYDFGGSKDIRLCPKVEFNQNELPSFICPDCIVSKDKFKLSAVMKTECGWDVWTINNNGKKMNKQFDFKGNRIVED